MPYMAHGTLKINTEKLLPIIKKWLYSDKDIFLRELVSNACDALSKLKILREQKQVDFEDSSLRIDIELDKKAKTLTITDTGIGMTADEVERYIAQLAFSGAEEFLSKYQSSEEKDQVIGHFGLGFYSAYMVSSQVEIQTLSYLPDATPAYWSCDGTSDYTIDTGTRTERGTQIILHINDEEFLDENRLRDILLRYCAFLPFPIYLNREHINHKDPLWLKPASECTKQDYLEFYRQLFPFEADPIFWIHLNVDYPFNLKGILYFPKIHPRFDYQKSMLQLFCNRVFVSDNCQELIPEYLSILRGAIDSPNIPLNVSRSYLQMDQTVRSLSTHISKKVADRLVTLHHTELTIFQNAWEDIETIVKLGVLQDDKFYERVKDILIWKNSTGNWITLPESKTIYYTQDANSPTLALYKDVEVLIAKNPLDIPLISFLESKLSIKFHRIDSTLDPLLDPQREKTLLDSEGRTHSSRLADQVRSALSHITDLTVEAKSLTNDQVPSLLLLDEQTRRMRDTLALSQRTPMAFPDKKTFVVNTNSPLIQSISAHPDANDLLFHLYQLSLLAQKELPPQELTSFLERSTQLLEKLLKK